MGEAPRGWDRRVDKVLLNLGMEKMMLDHALYALRDKDKALIGCLAVHVNNFVYAGNNHSSGILVIISREPSLLVSLNGESSVM